MKLRCSVHNNMCDRKTRRVRLARNVMAFLYLVLIVCEISAIEEERVVGMVNEW